MEPNWEVIKNEYVTTKASYSELGEKYGIPKSTVAKHGNRERWVDERARFGTKIYQEALGRAREACVEHLGDVRAAVERSVELILRRLNDEEKAREMSAGELRNYTASLKELDRLLRDYYNVPTPSEAEARRISGERLNLERRKLETDQIDGSVYFELSPELEEWSK